VGHVERKSGEQIQHRKETLRLSKLKITQMIDLVGKRVCHEPTYWQKTKEELLIHTCFSSRPNCSLWFIPRNALCAQRGIAIVNHPSVRLSVRDVNVLWAYVLG